MAENKTDFTFSFFDAAHTDGYVALTSKKNISRDDNQLSRGGFFSDNEGGNEDIVTKIHHWQQCSQTDAKSKAPRNSVKLHDLFSGTPMKEPKPKDNIPPSSAEIQLSRLLDDYMLGAQGDYIIQQMEDLTTDDDPPSLATSPNTQRVQAKSFGDLEANINKKGHVEPLPNLDNMMSMEDFEKYIANN